MRKISSGSSPCKVEEMSELSLTVLPVESRLLEIQLKLNLERTSCLTQKYGYVHSCPTNLGTGMRASVHVDL